VCEKCVAELAVGKMKEEKEYHGYTTGLFNAVPAGAMAPVIYFPGALFYSASFNVNQNFKEKIFPNSSLFQLFS
jgi:hypothetical protein